MTLRSSDRRTFRRSGTEQHGIVSARVRPGDRAAVIDVSAGGALIETARRLLPGSAVQLHVETAQRRIALGGRVLRCAVVRLRASSVCYQAAIAFDRQLPWFIEGAQAGYPVPIDEMPPMRQARVDATPTAASDAGDLP